MMKRIWAVTVAAALSVCAPAFAQAPAKTPTGPFGGDITGIFTVANEYSFRGISQTTRDFAVQGGLTYEVPIFKPVSLYAGLWGSNLNFATDINENVEIDIVAGAKVKFFDDKLVIDVGYIGYFYPGINTALGANYTEFAIGATYDFGFASLGAKVHFSPDFFFNSGNAWYKTAFVSVPLPFEIHKDIAVKLTASVGHQSISNNANFGSPDYWDFSAGVTVTAFTVDFTAQVIGTSLSQAECANTRFCKVRPYFSISKAF